MEYGVSIDIIEHPSKHQNTDNQNAHTIFYNFPNIFLFYIFFSHFFLAAFPSILLHFSSSFLSITLHWQLTWIEKLLSHYTQSNTLLTGFSNWHTHARHKEIIDYFLFLAIDIFLFFTCTWTTLIHTHNIDGKYKIYPLAQFFPTKRCKCLKFSTNLTLLFLFLTNKNHKYTNIKYIK